MDGGIYIYTHDMQCLEYAGSSFNQTTSPGGNAPAVFSSLVPRKRSKTGEYTNQGVMMRQWSIASGYD